MLLLVKVDLIFDFSAIFVSVNLKMLNRILTFPFVVLIKFYQFFISPGATDAGRVHVANSGIPSAVIGICARYIHSHASIIHVDDYAAAKQLLIELVKACDRATVEAIRKG